MAESEAVAEEAAKNPYRKLFANATEHPEPYEADVEGTIPLWVKGTLVRNGPGLFSVGPDSYTHFFDGLAFLHRFHIEEGKLVHSSRFLQSNSYKRNVAAQRIVVSEFGTMSFPDPCKNVFSRYLSHFLPGDFTDNASVNVVQLGDQLYATTETPTLSQIDPQTLETLRQVSRYLSHFLPGDFTDNASVNVVQLGDQLYATTETPTLSQIDPQTLETLRQVSAKSVVSVNTATAHPHYGRDGTAYNAASAIGCYKIVAVPPATKTDRDPYEQTRQVASIPCKPGQLSYYHSFGMSADHFIFLSMPLRMHPLKLMTAALTRRPYATAMEWKGKEDTVFHLLRRSDGKPSGLKYTSEAFFTFHHANSFEVEGCVVVDVCGYPDGSAIQQLTIEDLKAGKMPLLQKKEGRGNLWRWVIPLDVPEGAAPGTDLLKGRFKDFATTATAILQTDGSVRLTFEAVGQRHFEFPRYNYDMVNGRPYRYLYGTTFDHGLRGDHVIKLDLHTGKELQWSTNSDSLFPGEPVFVGRPGATEEDDGLVLTLISNAEDGEASFLLVQDAQSFEEVARAKIKSPVVPLGFHGHFMPNKD